VPKIWASAPFAEGGSGRSAPDRRMRSVRDDDHAPRGRLAPIPFLNYGQSLPGNPSPAAAAVVVVFYLFFFFILPQLLFAAAELPPPLFFLLVLFFFTRAAGCDSGRRLGRFEPECISPVRLVLQSAVWERLRSALIRRLSGPWRR
jgi:hypothetical protein